MPSLFSTPKIPTPVAPTIMPTPPVQGGNGVLATAQQQQAAAALSNSGRASTIMTQQGNSSDSQGTAATLG